MAITASFCIWVFVSLVAHAAPYKELIHHSHPFSNPHELLAQRSKALSSPRQATYINVQTHVVGAQVFVNGIYVGEVNRRIQVMPGVRKLEVVHQDYEDYSINLRILRGTNQIVRPQMVKKQLAPVQTQPSQMAAPLVAQPYPPQQIVPPNQGRQIRSQGAQHRKMRQKSWQNRRRRMLNNKKRRRSESSVSSPSKLYTSPPPKPRSSSDYAMSLLPLGIPQLNHKKPLLALIFFAGQAGGLGGYGYMYFYQLDTLTKQKKTDLDNYQKKLREATQLTNEQRNAKFNQYQSDWNKTIDRAKLMTWGAIGGAGLFYFLSVMEALMIGPPAPKSALEQLLSSHELCGESCPLWLPIESSSPPSLWSHFMHNTDMSVSLFSSHPMGVTPSLAFNWSTSL